LSALKTLVYTAGSLLCRVAMLPLPWRVRVMWYAFIGHLASAVLGLVPQVYDMLADDGARYHMGKDKARQIESIKVMELVLEQFEREQTSPENVAEVYACLKADGVHPNDVPYELANALLDERTQEKLLKHVKAL